MLPPVENAAYDFDVSGVQQPTRLLDNLPIGLSRLDHKDNTIAELAHGQAVRELEHGREIQKNVVEVLIEIIDQNSQSIDIILMKEEITTATDRNHFQRG